MRRWPRVLLMLTPLVAAACVPEVTQAGIERSLDEILNSVSGNWSSVGGEGTLAFKLTETTAGQLTGAGTWQSSGGTAAFSSITITGSYQRPDLALVFEGIVHEGRTVRGTFRGRYTTVGGVRDTLVLSGQDYSKRMVILLQEGALSGR